jgi:hypothetical protein
LVDRRHSFGVGRLENTGRASSIVSLATTHLIEVAPDKSNPPLHRHALEEIAAEDAQLAFITFWLPKHRFLRQIHPVSL